MKKRKNNEGKVYYGKTRYIDHDVKPRRRFVVVNDNGENIAVAKLGSLKKFDSKGKNVDSRFVEIDPDYPGLTKRTGAYNQLYKKNKVTKEKLSLRQGNGVFDKNPEFELTDVDFHKVDSHVIRRGKKRGKK